MEQSITRTLTPSMSNQEVVHETDRLVDSIPCIIFNELRLENQPCDVIIRVDDARFYAHKNILCGCSSLFKSLFTGSWQPKERCEFTISYFSSRIMPLILEYVYLQHVNITEKNVKELLKAADYLAVSSLVNECCAFLKTRLCLVNCIGIWSFAHLNLLQLLKQQAFRFIMYHFEEMVHVSEEFLKLTAEELSQIIENDQLNVKPEKVVFETILHWVGHAPQTRRAHMAALLLKLRLAVLPCITYGIRSIINKVLIGFYNQNRPSSSEFSRPRLPGSVLLAIGGWSRRAPTNALEAYDIQTDSWVNLTCNNESPRAYHGAVYLHGLVYCIGGYDGMNYHNSVRSFDPITKTWTQLYAMHCYRAYVSVCALDHRIYAMGGYDGADRLSTVERYEPENKRWSFVSPMLQPRSDASATTLNDKVYICGGFDGNRCSFMAEYYNPQTDQWTPICRMTCRRSGVGVIALQRQVYVVGGFNSLRRLKSAEVYNPPSNLWTSIPTMVFSRSNFGIEVVDDLLFVVGGFNGVTTIANVECYDTQTDRWYEVKDMGIPRSALSCCVVSDLPNVAEYAAPRDCVREVPQSIQSRIRNPPGPPFF